MQDIKSLTNTNKDIFIPGKEGEIISDPFSGGVRLSQIMDELLASLFGIKEKQFSVGLEVLRKLFFFIIGEH